jgi:hypothetical protein
MRVVSSSTLPFPDRGISEILKKRVKKILSEKNLFPGNPGKTTSPEIINPYLLLVRIHHKV